MKKNMIFIGLGQCGGKIADAAFKKGIRAFAVNCAKADLEHLTIPDSNKIFIDCDRDGTGKNREYAELLMKENMREVLYKIAEAVRDVDVIVVSAGLAGGFGSGSAPLFLKALDVFEKDVAGIFVLPSSKESFRARQNAVEAFADITRIKSTTFYTFIDNEKVDEAYPYKSLREKFELSNDTVISNIENIIDKADTHSYVKSFDRQDLLNILSERGNCIFENLSFPSADLEHMDAVSEIKNAFSKSFQMAENVSDALRAAVIFNISKGYDKFIDINAVRELFPKAYDFTYSIYETDDDISSIYIVANGMPFPADRVQEVENNLLGAETNVVNSIDYARNQEYQMQRRMDNFLSRKGPVFKELIATDKEKATLNKIDKLSF